MIIIKRILFSCLFYIGFSSLWASNDKISSISKEEYLANDLVSEIPSLKSDADFDNQSSRSNSISKKEIPRENNKSLSLLSQKESKTLTSSDNKENIQPSQGMNASSLKRKKSQENDGKSKKRRKKSSPSNSEHKDQTFTQQKILFPKATPTPKKIGSSLTESKKEKLEDSKPRTAPSYNNQFRNRGQQILRSEDTSKKFQSEVPKFLCPSADVEQEFGSRRFVKNIKSGFSNIKGVENTNKWYREKSELIKKVAAINSTKQYIEPSKNFALARITYIDEKHSFIKEEELPYLFISGWPSNQDIESKKLEKLSEESLLNEYEGIHFLTMSYSKGKKEQTRGRNYGSYQKDLANLIDEAMQRDNCLVDRDRLKYHKGMIHSIQSLSQLYFHSEPCILEYLRKEIKGKLKSLKNVRYCILDIISRYDMCWCCGDIISTSFHVHHNNYEEIGIPIFVRVIGLYGYDERTFLSSYDEKKLGYLREDRKSFRNYLEGDNYNIELNKEGKLTSYCPYISHSIIEDL